MVKIRPSTATIVIATRILKGSRPMNFWCPLGILSVRLHFHQSLSVCLCLEVRMGNQAAGSAADPAVDLRTHATGSN